MSPSSSKKRKLSNVSTSKATSNKKRPTFSDAKPSLAMQRKTQTELVKTKRDKAGRSRGLLTNKLDVAPRIAPQNTSPIPETLLSDPPNQPHTFELLDEEFANPNEDVDLLQSAEEPTGTTKKSNNTNLMKIGEWLPHRDVFLDQIIHYEGPISEQLATRCADCHSEIEESTGFRCRSCFNSNLVLCSSCIVKTHKRNPFHIIERWTDNHFEQVSLTDLGYTLQLGHDGQACPKPSKPINTLIAHTSGFFQISVSCCNCLTAPSQRFSQFLQARLFPTSLQRIQMVFMFDVLETFQELNLHGKIPIYDFYRTLISRTDFFKLGKTPHRRIKSQLSNFHRAVRLWRHLQALKRAGRGHSQTGAKGTRAGELIIECPACPQPNKNLPPDWNSDPTTNFLYSLFIAIDANFKLKGKERRIKDAELGSGWGAFVNEEEYQKYLSEYSEQKEINTCHSEHDAIVRAAVRRTPGYAVTGAGLVICSRHCLIRPNGAGDLQKGERYCNMDYILFSAIMALGIIRLVITYDIACQWSRNFHKRMATMPESLQIPDAVDVIIAIPAWHINAHGKKCKENFNVGHLKGVGRLCGDEIEQTWWNTNSLGTSVREMGAGARHETLNDQWNAHNIQRIVALRPRLAKNLRTAAAMFEKQKENFIQFSSSFAAEQRDTWESMVVNWENNHSKPNPYEEKEIKSTLQDIRLKLVTEEAEAARRGKIQLHEKTSLSSFILSGLEIEEQQRILSAEIDTLGSPLNLTSKQKADVKEKQSALYRRLSLWREIQRVYTPMVASMLEEIANNIDQLTAEKQPLFLPSSIPSSLHSLVKEAVRTEGRLREGQAEDALTKICRLRRILKGATIFKRQNLGGEGNRANTRLRSMYQRIETKIRHAAATYRVARTALLTLEPESPSLQRFLELRDEDISGPYQETDESYRSRTLSWIWTVPKAQSEEHENEDTQLNESLRVEWAKARARVFRWEEEVALIKEEMRRVVAYYLQWKAKWWEEQAGQRTGIPESIKLGLRGYAFKQASLSRKFALSCIKCWTPVLEKVSEAPVEWEEWYKGKGTADDSHDLEDEDEEEIIDEEEDDVRGTE